VEKNHKTSLVVCDAGPIIHLHQLGCLDLVGDLGRVLVPPTVWHEVERHRPEALSTPGVELERVAPQKPAGADMLAVVQAFSLDAGETEALVLMQSMEASVFLTDDSAARLAATQLRFEVHGTIGVLLRGIRRGLKSSAEVITLLQELPTRSSLYIQPLLQEVIEAVESCQ
jgi:predicted nucleic acid-binding protein